MAGMHRDKKRWEQTVHPNVWLHGNKLTYMIKDEEYKAFVRFLKAYLIQSR